MLIQQLESFPSLLLQHFSLGILASVPIGLVDTEVSKTPVVGEETYTLPAAEVHISEVKVILANLVPAHGYPGFDLLVSNAVISESPFCLLSKKVEFCATTGIFLVGGFSADSVRLFTQLLLSELVQSYGQWASRSLGMVQADFVAAGHRVFENGFLEVHLHEDHYHVNFARDTRRNIGEWLLPSVRAIRSSTAETFKTMAWLVPSSPWKKLCSRGYYMTMVKTFDTTMIENPLMLEIMESFRVQVLSYIYDNYEVLPLLAKDKLWNTRQKRLQLSFCVK
ncbi:hypothetical protein INT47_008907 [Mucor saturninus]|uniref:Uncharacterized protein n=1 Tax=Mucor saturninus TaxID=64648 RepID=A0A8H7QI47_9FUNG|nr:hypothetical protein INT47_008907 [Mucor saturninus]